MFTNAKDAIEYALAGNAIVTLASRRSGSHYTFKVRAAKNANDLFFVNLLTGPDNTADYTYLGTVRAGSFGLTRKSRLTEDSIPVRAFRYFFEHATQGDLPPALEVRHEGRCGRCGRLLTVPESLDRGIGPECAKHHLTH